MQITTRSMVSERNTRPVWMSEGAGDDSEIIWHLMFHHYLCCSSPFSKFCCYVSQEHSNYNISPSYHAICVHPETYLSICFHYKQTCYQTERGRLLLSYYYNCLISMPIFTRNRKQNEIIDCYSESQTLKEFKLTDLNLDQVHEGGLRLNRTISTTGDRKWTTAVLLKKYI